MVRNAVFERRSGKKRQHEDGKRREMLSLGKRRNR